MTRHRKFFIAFPFRDCEYFVTSRVASLRRVRSSNGLKGVSVRQAKRRLQDGASLRSESAGRTASASASAAAVYTGLGRFVATLSAGFGVQTGANTHGEPSVRSESQRGGTFDDLDELTGFVPQNVGGYSQTDAQQLEARLNQARDEAYSPSDVRRGADPNRSRQPGK